MPETKTLSTGRAVWVGVLIILGLVVFCFLFVVVDNAYYKFAAARFPPVGSSAWQATLWGLVSRAHLLLLEIPLVLWRPRLFGFQIGKISHHWRMLVVMLLVNCGVIAAYLWLTGSSTPYSGNQWFVTEVITVPVVEETFWRGLVFAALLLVLERFYPQNFSIQATIWLSGLAFGLLHAANSLVGVPIQFVAIQSLNAAIWGVMYGYARAITKSVYPPMFLHAAMNLVVILF